MRQMLDFMSGCDILLSAVTPVPPFVAGAGVNTPDAAAYPTWFHWARLGWLLNVVGLPAASYPWGLDRGGMPVGIQVAANPFREDLVRCVSLELERHAPVRLPDNGLWQ
jgi:aspartyl-tRNA(Asn)/glutamyl-tRNA(Gln) amidotransferase subunit A